MFQEMLFWFHVLYAFTIGRRRTIASAGQYFLATVREGPMTDPASQEALHLIHQILNPYRQGLMGGVLGALPNQAISIEQVQWAFDQLLQPGGFWRYQPHENEIVFFMPSPWQYRVIRENEILQEMCLEHCWNSGRCIISPRRFRKLRADTRSVKWVITRYELSEATLLQRNFLKKFPTQKRRPMSRLDYSKLKISGWLK